MLDVDALAGMIAGIIEEHVEKATTPLIGRIAELEARAPLHGPPGEKGANGADGKDGVDGRDGINGENGKDGRGIKSLLIDREGQLVAAMDDGSVEKLGPVIGKDGAPGRDGFGLDDFDCQPVDERTIKLMFTRGEVAHSFELEFPVVIDRGVYKAGQPYARGDAVTWAGSLWIAQKDTNEKPGDGDGFRLAVKRGRDGKDAK